MSQIVIRQIKAEEWDDAISLIWRTFLRFEAGDYEQEGISAFLEFISDERLKKLWCIGDYPMYAAFELSTNEMLGVISYRGENLISLLFVADKHQKRGIGRALVQTVSEEVKAKGRKKELLVRAAPYAIEFYHRLGFLDTDTEQKKQGIRYVPMSLALF